MGQMGMEELVDEIDRGGILHPDHFIAGGPREVADTESYWTRLIRGLRPGISEIYCHPAFARAELLGCARDARQREADFRFFTSESVRRIIRDEGIELIGYRKLRDAMRAA